ncbi:polysaccharide pyruvyl transferase family protein [Rothia sp. 11254D007CT]
MHYAHPLNRLKRSLGRIHYYWDVVPSRRAVKIVKTFWWDQAPNFGDLLTEYILPHYGIAPVLVAAEKAKLVSVGSVLNMVDADFGGSILGSGVMHPDRDIDLKKAKIYALRGKLSKKKLNVKEDIALGDPGLLMSKILPLEEIFPTGKIGFIPHFTHQEKDYIKNIWKTIESNAIYIDVRKSPREVAVQIKKCSAIFSTSLHGVILADSYGVPVVWSMPPAGLPGGDFKFRDYESVVLDSSESRKVDIFSIRTTQDIFDNAKVASRDKVNQSIEELEKAIDRLGDEIKSANFYRVVFSQLRGPAISAIKAVPGMKEIRSLF